MCQGSRLRLPAMVLPSPAMVACQVVHHYLVGVGFDSVPFSVSCEEEGQARISEKEMGFSGDF